MARALHGADDRARLAVDLHDTSGKGVVGDVFDVVAVRDDPHLVVGRDEDVLRRAEVVPFAQVLAVGIEDLDAVVLAVADVDDARGIDRDRVNGIELAPTRAGLAPRGDVLAFRGELDDARVAVTVGDVDLARGSEGKVGRPVEALGVVARYALVADGAAPLSLVGELHDGVVNDVGRPDVVVLVDAQPVRPAEHPLAPRAHVAAFGVEHDDRVGLVAAVEDVDLAGGVGGHGRDAPELPAVRHRVGFLAEANVHAVLQQAAFVVVPAGLPAERETEAGQEGQGPKRHGNPPLTLIFLKHRNCSPAGLGAGRLHSVRYFTRKCSSLVANRPP